jgi:Spy/CpxP family protein refolding chaperone
LLLLAALATGIGSIAAAQCPMHAMAAGDPPAATETPAPPAMMNPHGGCGGPMGGTMMGPMGLSEDQRQAIQKIRTDAQAGMMPARKEMMRLRNTMQGEMLKDEIDAGAVRKLVQKMGDLRTQMQLQRLEQRLAVRQLLTPEQRDRTMMRMGRGDECCPGGMRGMHRGMGRGGRMGGHGGGCMGGPGCGGMGGSAGGPGCSGMGGSGKGCKGAPEMKCTPGPGCGHMQAPPQGKDSGALPGCSGPGGGPEFGAGFGPDPDLDLLAEFDLDFGPDFDLGFDEDPDGMEAPGVPDVPAAPEPPMEPMTP